MRMYYYKEDAYSCVLTNGMRDFRDNPMSRRRHSPSFFVISCCHKEDERNRKMQALSCTPMYRPFSAPWVWTVMVSVLLLLPKDVVLCLTIPRHTDSTAPPSDHHHDVVMHPRRTFLATTITSSVVAASTLVWPVRNNDAWAMSNDEKPAEFTNVGQQAPPPTAGDTPFVTLPNGVQIKDYRVGGTAADLSVQPGSKVALQITGRLLNLNGIVFYDSKRNDPVDGLGGLPVTFTVAEGAAIPGLEAGIMGMKKGGIRRIIVPPSLGYNPDGPLLEPIPTSAVDQRALDSVLKNPRRDATLLFDCKLERIK